MFKTNIQPGLINVSNSFLILRIKGQVNLPHWVVTTFKLFNMEKKYRATIIPKQDNYIGMLNKIKNYACWTDAEMSLVEELINKRAYKVGNIKFTDSDAIKSGFDNINHLAQSISDGKTTLPKIKMLKPWFALSPPKHGFKKSTKKMYSENGILGYNKDLGILIKNMM